MSQDSSQINHSQKKSAISDSRQVVIIAASLVLATSFLALVLNLVHTNHGRAILSIAIGFVLVTIILAYRNFLQPARIITPVVAFLILTFFLVDGDGVHDASITAYAAVVILAGLLLGERGVVVFGALTTISLLSLAYAEYYEVAALRTKYTGFFDFIDINTIWFLQLATSAAIYFLVHRLSRVANEAREGEEEFARANDELSTLRDILQERVDRRTESLELQNRALQAASRVANGILSAKGVAQLLEISANLIAKEFGFDHVGLFLLNEKKDRAILQTVSSEGGKQMLKDRYELPTDRSSVVGIVAQEKLPRIALNQGADSVLFDAQYSSDMKSEIAIPLISQEDVLGVLDIQSKEVDAFSQGNISIFQSLANQIALTIQNTRLIEEAQVNLAQLELIVAEQSAVVWNRYLQQKSYGFIYTPLGVKPLRMARVEKEERSNIEKTEIPITLRGRKIGTISLQRLSRHWTPKEKSLLADVATQIGLAVENARLLHETREQATQEQLVSDISSRLRETLDMDTVLKTAIEEMKKTFNLKEVEVRLASTPPPEAKS